MSHSTAPAGQAPGQSNTSEQRRHGNYTILSDNAETVLSVLKFEGVCSAAHLELKAGIPFLIIADAISEIEAVGYVIERVPGGFLLTGGVA